MKHFLPLFIVSLTFLNPVQAGRETFAISEQLDTEIKAGLHELYNFNFEKANTIFDGLKEEGEKHPMISFGKASSEWWRVSSLVLEQDEQESAAFLTSVQECIKISERIVKEGDATGEAHLTLGGAYGLLGRWEATNGQWMSAYFKGKKALKYLDKSMKINPELHDAKMGLGMFDYIVATLPAVIRSVAFIGKGGDPKVGLRELEEAASLGTYAQTPSKLFLCQIYTQMEKTPEKSLALLGPLRDEYPESPFMHMMQIISLYSIGDLAALKKESASFLKKFTDHKYPALYVAQAHFALGAAAFKSREWEAAAKHFSDAYEKSFDKDPWKTWALLYRGYCYDALEKREEAKAEYKKVLDVPRRWGSHDAAKSHLKRPFQGTDEELKMLML